MKKDKASSTALTVAQGILYRADQPDTATLVSEEVSDALKKILSSSIEGRKRLSQLQNPFYKIILPIMESLVVPGISISYVLRKRYIEDYALKCINDGVSQVINLGAGFDTLCYRLSKSFEHVDFIEIDHPATSKLKVEALKNEPCFDKNLTLISVDFTKQTLENRLGKHPKFINDKPTLFISEGVLMYLTEEQVKHQLYVIKEMTKTSPKLIFTYVEQDALKSGDIGLLFPLILKISGEPYLWSIKNKNLGGFLKSNGYELKSTKSAAEFKTNYITEDYKGTIYMAAHIAIAEEIG